MATDQPIDARALLKAGNAPEVPEYISEDDAWELSKKGTIVTCYSMEHGEQGDRDFFYWQGVFTAGKSKRFLFDMANNPRRDDFNEWLSLNTSAGPITGLVIRNGAKPGKKPFFYLSIAE